MGRHVLLGKGIPQASSRPAHPDTSTHRWELACIEVGNGCAERPILISEASMRSVVTSHQLGIIEQLGIRLAN